MTEEKLRPVPISREDAVKAAEAFRNQWDPSVLINRGLPNHIADVLHILQDDGSITLFTWEEIIALHDHMEDVVEKVWKDDPSISSELSSAIKKISYQAGRVVGLMNIDMGIEETEHHERR